MTNRAVCYIRVSTQEQALHGVSLDAQEERPAAYCKMQGLESLQVFREEAVSGSKALNTRPKGAEMLEILNKKRATHIVALKLDRLFRSAEDALRQTKDWDARGLTLHLVDMGGQSLNTSSAMGRMMLTMMAAFAEFERNLISERTTAALRHKRNHLQPYAQIPFGFDRQENALIPNEYEQGIIRQIRQWRNGGLTLRAIASRLNREKVPAKNAGQWFASTVRQILENPIQDC
jgi:DNA invertase Pin-like site-specific DNA recombinase